MRSALIAAVLGIASANVQAAPTCGANGCTIKNRPVVKWAMKATPVRDLLRRIVRGK